LDGTVDKELDYNHAVRLAESVWWVGHYLLDDPLQCHVYLIEAGDQSVLIDPGSKLTFDKTLEKIEEIIPFDRIKYFVAHHQDPDITGSFQQIDELVTRKDAVILSHWRTNALLKHLALGLPLNCVEEMDWKLDLPGRQLQFVFTPYLHFAGAFTTFDKKTGVLFSSDLYGGFTEGWSLFAESGDYFESMRLFHEHYMPSKEILRHTIKKFQQLPLTMIAPQHGSIISRELIEPITEELRNLDCGIFLKARRTSDLYKLSDFSRFHRTSLEILTTKRDFREIKEAFTQNIKRLIPLKCISFYIKEPDGRISKLAEKENSGEVGARDILLNSSMIGLTQKAWQKKYGQHFFLLDRNVLIIPLFSSETKKVLSLSVLELEKGIAMDEELADVIDEIVLPLSVAVEREVILGKVTMEKNKFYEQAIRDRLTGLYTRVYMEEAVTRLMKIHDRNESSAFAVIMFDLDHFKRVNDLYGHIAGDEVLSKAAEVITECTRGEDINVRYGGEEFASFIVTSNCQTVVAIAERVRTKIEKMRIRFGNQTLQITVSGGVAFRKQKESLENVLKRADMALYHAKEKSRNSIQIHSLEEREQNEWKR